MTIQELTPRQTEFYHLTTEKLNSHSVLSEYQKNLLIEFIEEFPLLDTTQVISFTGRIITDTNSLFRLWWEENEEEIYDILFG